MSKAVLALFTGMLAIFIADFFFFLGMKTNYFDALGIEIYYNTLFADNQNALLYFGLSIVVGFVIIFIANKKLTVIVLFLLSIFSISALIPNIGYTYAQMMFKKVEITYHDARHTFSGDVYYEGRKTIHFFDNDLQRIIILQKKDLIR